jgi:hypothetical protein
LLRVRVVLTVGASLLAGCGFGLRTGAGVSRTQEPVMLTSTIGEAPTTVDGSLGTEWIELEVLADYHHVRPLFVLGAALGQTRFRAMDPQSSQPYFAEDGNFLARVGGGVGFAPLAIGPIRPAPYVLYTRNFGVLQSTLSSSLELGLDVELAHDAITFVVGAALTYESGNAQINTGCCYQGTFDTQGVVVTFGGRFGGVRFDQ